MAQTAGPRGRSPVVHVMRWLPGMRRMMAHYDKHGLPGGNPLVLRSILGREPRSLKDYFRELASG